MTYLLCAMQNADAAPIGRAEIDGAMEDILAQDEFLANRNPAQILKFVIEETLEGRGDRLKAFTIATLALNRDSSFDAQSDSIVRVQAARLRQLLANYYAGPGASAAIRIELPRGAYKPAITRRQPSPNPAPEIAAEGPAEIPAQQGPAETAEIPAPALPSPDPRPAPPEGRSRRGFWLAVAAAAFALLLFVIDSYIDSRPPASPPAPIAGNDALQRPVVSVAALDAPGQPLPVDQYTRRMADLIGSGLSAFDHFVVREASGARGQGAGDYTLDVQTAPTGVSTYEAAFRLVHRGTGDIVWSRSFAVDALDDAAAQKRIAGAVIPMVGDLYGVVFADQLRRAPPQARSRVSLCLLKGFEFIKSRDPAQGREASKCLDQAIDASPDDARLLGVQAIVLTRLYLDAMDDHGAADLQRALSLARRAYDLEPTRARPQFVGFLTRFYDKRFDDAFEAARKAMETNPWSGAFAAAIGAAYISRGDFAAGDALLQPLLKMETLAPRPFLAFLALSAYMRDDFDAARRLVRRGQDHNVIGLLMRALVCQRDGESDCAHAAQLQLREQFPAFAADIPASLDRYALSDSIRQKVLKDLRESGLLVGAAL
jgi:adenylate cyclase